jgi:hypothetical protein
MGNINLSISSQGAQEYRALAKRLRKQKEFRKKLRMKIAEAGKPAVTDVRQAVMALNVTSHGGGSAQRRGFAVSKAKTARAKASASKRDFGLRRRIAAATGVQITAKGIRIRVSGSSLPPNQRSLPRHLDSPKGWRHPVFGNTSNWVNQKGGPYFAKTISKRAPTFRRAVLSAMDEIAKEIDS